MCGCSEVREPLLSDFGARILQSSESVLAGAHRCVVFLDVERGSVDAGEVVPRARGGFHRDCCNSIAVTRDARIGNVTNHERRLFVRSGCLVDPAVTCLHESYPGSELVWTPVRVTRSLMTSSTSTSDTWTRRGSQSLFYFDVSPTPRVSLLDNTSSSHDRLTRTLPLVSVLVAGGCVTIFRAHRSTS